MTLIEALSKVEDPRRSEGRRTSLEQILSMIIIASLCGYFGGRRVARFAKVHAEEFKQELGLKHPVPSHVTFSDLINRVNSEQLKNAFNDWTSGYVPLSSKELLSADGKGLGSTIENQFNNTQDFQAVVSLFCQNSGLIYALEYYRNAKKSEIDIVNFLIQKLNNMGVTVFMDALHCQKKQSTTS